MSPGSSRVETDALRSIREKLARASRQFQSLERSIGIYWDKDPMRVDGEFNPNFTQYVCRLEIIDQPPIDWSVRLAEAIHNLRSALDHVVHQLTLSHMGYPVENSAFPIFGDARKFQSEGRSMVRGVSRDALALIESVQPYQSDNPRATALWYIHQIRARDTHSHIPLMPAITGDVYSFTVDPVDTNATVTIMDGLKEDGALLALVDLTRPVPTMQVILEPVLYIANEFSWELDPDITSAHRTTVDGVTDIVERLLELID